jgi:hypothetical protein
VGGKRSSVGDVLKWRSKGYCGQLLDVEVSHIVKLQFRSARTPLEKARGST